MMSILSAYRMENEALKERIAYLETTIDSYGDDEIFECNLGPDLSFEGTKRSFNVYIDGLTRLLTVLDKSK